MMHQDMSKNNFSSPQRIYPQTLHKTTRASQTQLLGYEAVGEWMGLMKMTFNQTLAEDEKKDQPNNKLIECQFQKGCKELNVPPWLLLFKYGFVKSQTVDWCDVFLWASPIFACCWSAVSFSPLLFGFLRTIKCAPNLSWVVSYKDLIQLNWHMAIRSQDMLVLLWSALAGVRWKVAGKYLELNAVEGKWRYAGNLEKGWFLYLWFCLPACKLVLI